MTATIETVPGMPGDAPAPHGPPGPPAAPRRRGLRALAVVLVLTLSGAGTYAYMEYVRGAEQDRPAVNEVTSAAAHQQATLVDQEDLRIMQSRAVLESTLARGGPQAAQMRQPHIASSANGRTLVLPQRSRPYYVSDLERYGREDFQKQRDGSYLLSIHLFAADGAKLVLQNATGPLTIKMRSVPGSFSSIVGFGASIRINGSAQNPVRITSWNPATDSADTVVDDGRSYVRAIGGELRMRHAQVSHLGFWSGRTGGIALTGTDRPSDSAEPAGRTAAGTGTVLLPDGRRERIGESADEIAVRAARGGASLDFTVPAANLVTGSIHDSTMDGNAYGAFISGSNETELVGNTVRDSLVHGVMMHRFARNASIENTTVTGSRGDGFVLSRATQNVKISGSTAAGNGGNGFTLSGLPLAEGPSASGESVTGFGNSSVSSSIARDNGGYGIELRGGTSLAVQTSKVIGGDMGIVVSERATGVQISGNELTGQRRQGMALRDGVTGAQLSGNVVRDTRTAIYLRGSSATITGNTVHGASLHAVTLIGRVGGTTITDNTLGGAGRSAIDARRADAAPAARDNNTAGWEETTGLWTMVRRAMKPMNIVWSGVFLLVIVSVVRSRGSGPRIGARIVHPYRDQTPLDERPARPLPAVPGDPAAASAAPAVPAPGTGRHVPSTGSL